MSGLCLKNDHILTFTGTYPAFLIIRYRYLSGLFDNQIPVPYLSAISGTLSGRKRAGLPVSRISGASIVVPV